VKAADNAVKHRVTFEEAMAVFGDPLAASMVDPDHLDAEERWITIGADGRGNLVLVVHTWTEMGTDRVRARLISARRPTRAEVRQYREGLQGMRDEYDFSNAERGRFYRPDAELIPPVHLEPEVLAFLKARAVARGVSLDALVNELLKKDIERIEAAE
jgi:uncharacterized DUF497 family protein